MPPPRPSRDGIDSVRQSSDGVRQSSDGTPNGTPPVEAPCPWANPTSVLPPQPEKLAVEFLLSHGEGALQVAASPVGENAPQKIFTLQSPTGDLPGGFTMARTDSGGLTSQQSRMRPAELARLKRLFALFDANGNGEIDKDELESAMLRLGRKFGEGEAEELIRMVDVNGTGLIEFEELLQIVAIQQCDAEEARASRDVFRHFFTAHLKNEAKVDAAQLMEGMQRTGVMEELKHVRRKSDLSEAGVARAMLALADLNHDGFIDVNEFCVMVRRAGLGALSRSEHGKEQPYSQEAMQFWMALHNRLNSLWYSSAPRRRCSKPNWAAESPDGEEHDAGVAKSSEDLAKRLREAPDGVPVKVTLAAADFTEPITASTLRHVKHLTLQGSKGKGLCDPRTRIVVSVKGAAVGLCGKSFALRDVDIEQQGSGPAVLHNGLGHGALINCTIKTSEGDAVVVTPQEPGKPAAQLPPLLMEKCTITGCHSQGMHVSSGRVMMTDCEVSGCKKGGIVVDKMGHAWVSNCEISKNMTGISYSGNATGVLSNCKMLDNTYVSVLIEGGAAPTVWKNTIRGGEHGVIVQKQGLGNVEENIITCCESSAIMTMTRGKPNVLRNILEVDDGDHQGASGYGVVVDGGSGWYEHNKIEGYRIAVCIKKGSEPTLTHNTVTRQGQGPGHVGIRLESGAAGSVMENMLVGWQWQEGQSIQRGGSKESVPIQSVGGGHRCNICSNIARPTQDECDAERLVHLLGTHTLVGQFTMAANKQPSSRPTSAQPVMVGTPMTPP